MAHETRGPLDVLANPFEEVADTEPGGKWVIAKHHQPDELAIQLPPFVSKFMVLELLAFGIILAIFIPACRRIAQGGVPRGRLAHGVEAVLLFIRDEVAIPTIGEHHYRKFLPFLWTLFLFILVMNLLGIIPFMGSPTASIAVTGILALVAFLVIHYHGIKENHGFGHYLQTFRVKIDREGALLKILAPFIEVGIFLLEVLTAFIRGIVLAVRLFANMLAGHTTLFVLLSFIAMIGLAVENGSAGGGWFYLITPGSVISVVLLSLLELFVALLQAFVFVFLTSTFLGMAMHPEH
jgi:F-type H+-transporting ATPase subunit a